MRHIPKGKAPPASIREWREVQEPVGLNLDYDSFNRKAALRAELVEEQYGLCGYTGTPLDDRLGGYQETDRNLAFQAHIEHIKPRSVCRLELEERGAEYGREICEDMDHRNLVAALEVRRKPPAKSELFGAAAHGNDELPVTPVQPDCEQRFRYDDNGGVTGTDDDAKNTIKLLKLNHTTLEGWRRGAIWGFLPVEVMPTREDLQQMIDVLDGPANGRLAEFSFCIRSHLQFLLGESED